MKWHFHYMNGKWAIYRGRYGESGEVASAYSIDLAWSRLHKAIDFHSWVKGDDFTEQPTNNQLTTNKWEGL